MESYLVPVERLGKVAQVSQADSDSQEGVVDVVNTQQEAMLEMNIVEAHSYVEYQAGLVHFQVQT